LFASQLTAAVNNFKVGGSIIGYYFIVTIGHSWLLFATAIICQMDKLS
jgi:hypothetical protein